MSDSASRPLVAGALTAIGASVCCAGPLILLGLGISGAWITHLTKFEPVQPIFIGFTLIFLGLAFRKLYLQPAACAPGTNCALPNTRRNQRIIFWFVSVMLLAVIAFPWYAPLFY